MAFAGFVFFLTKSVHVTVYTDVHTTSVLTSGNKTLLSVEWLYSAQGERVDTLPITVGS